MSGILMVSRDVVNHGYYTKQAESLGFGNITFTCADKDGLNYVIAEKRPELIMMSARFYQCCTPYLMGELKKMFPKINMAAIGIGEYPADLAMYFILNGAKGYVNTFDGFEDFFKGIEEIRRGKEYIPNVVQKRIDMRFNKCLKPAHTLSAKQVEVARCICNGFTREEMGDILQLSVRSVTTYREDIYHSLNVRNSEELYSAVITLGICTQEEFIFRHSNFSVKPLPDNGKKRGKYKNACKN